MTSPGGTKTVDDGRSSAALRVAFASHDQLPRSFCTAPCAGSGSGSGGRPRRGAFTVAAPGRARLVQSLRDGGEGTPTTRQIIFSRIIMLARKVATDLCLLPQSLPCIFVCTICSGALHWALASHRLPQRKPDNARAA